MTTLGFIILCAGGFALFMYLKSGNQGGSSSGRNLPASSSPTGERTVKNLQLNDIVEVMGQSFMVEGKLTYREDGDEWWEYRLVDGSDVRYLSVEDDDVLEVMLWQEIDLTISEGGPDEHIEWAGERFQCTERGKATVSRVGQTGRKEGMSCRYWDYEGSGDKALCVEKWSGDWEVSEGEPLRDGAYDILPGDLIGT